MSHPQWEDANGPVEVMFDIEKSALEIGGQLTSSGDEQLGAIMAELTNDYDTLFAPFTSMRQLGDSSDSFGDVTFSDESWEDAMEYTQESQPSVSQASAENEQFSSQEPCIIASNDLEISQSSQVNSTPPAVDDPHDILLDYDSSDDILFKCPAPLGRLDETQSVQEETLSIDMNELFNRPPRIRRRSPSTPLNSFEAALQEETVEGEAAQLKNLSSPTEGQSQISSPNVCLPHQPASSVTANQQLTEKLQQETVIAKVLNPVTTITAQQLTDDQQSENSTTTAGTASTAIPCESHVIHPEQSEEGLAAKLSGIRNTKAVKSKPTIELPNVTLSGGIEKPKVIKSKLTSRPPTAPDPLLDHVVPHHETQQNQLSAGPITELSSGEIADISQASHNTQLSTKPQAGQKAQKTVLFQEQQQAVQKERFQSPQAQGYMPIQLQKAQYQLPKSDDSQHLQVPLSNLDQNHLISSHTHQRGQNQIPVFRLEQLAQPLARQMSLQGHGLAQNPQFEGRQPTPEQIRTHHLSLLLHSQQAELEAKHKQQEAELRAKQAQQKLEQMTMLLAQYENAQIMGQTLYQSQLPIQNQQSWIQPQSQFQGQSPYLNYPQVHSPPQAMPYLQAMRPTTPQMQCNSAYQCQNLPIPSHQRQPLLRTQDVLRYQLSNLQTPVGSPMRQHISAGTHQAQAIPLGQGFSNLLGIQTPPSQNSSSSMGLTSNGPREQSAEKSLPEDQFWMAQVEKINSQKLHGAKGKKNFAAYQRLQLQLQKEQQPVQGGDDGNFFVADPDFNT